MESTAKTVPIIVLDKILECTGPDKPTCYSASLVCRHWREPSQRCLFRLITVLEEPAAQALIESFESPHIKPQWVKSFASRTSSLTGRALCDKVGDRFLSGTVLPWDQQPEENPVRMKQIKSLVSSFPNLTSLRIEEASPVALTPQDPLPTLKTLRLGAHDRQSTYRDNEIIDESTWHNSSHQWWTPWIKVISMMGLKHLSLSKWDMCSSRNHYLPIFGRPTFQLESLALEDCILDLVSFQWLTGSSKGTLQTLSMVSNRVCPPSLTKALIYDIRTLVANAPLHTLRFSTPFFVVTDAWADNEEYGFDIQLVEKPSTLKTVTVFAGTPPNGYNSIFRSIISSGVETMELVTLQQAKPLRPEKHLLHFLEAGIWPVKHLQKLVVYANMYESWEAQTMADCCGDLNIELQGYETSPYLSKNTSQEHVI